MKDIVLYDELIEYWDIEEVKRNLNDLVFFHGDIEFLSEEKIIELNKWLTKTRSTLKNGFTSVRKIYTDKAKENLKQERECTSIPIALEEKIQKHLKEEMKQKNMKIIEERMEYLKMYNVPDTPEKRECILNMNKKEFEGELQKTKLLYWEEKQKQEQEEKRIQEFKIQAKKYVEEQLRKEKEEKELEQKKIERNKKVQEFEENIRKFDKKEINIEKKTITYYKAIAVFIL